MSSMPWFERNTTWWSWKLIRDEQNGITLHRVPS